MQTGMSRGSLWQRHKKMTWMFVFSLLGVSCVIFIIYAYKSGLEWTGFNASQGPDTQQYQPTKTLWDWLQLLIVPIVLSVAASWLNHQNSQLEQRMTIERDKTEHDIALDNQRAELLQGYLDRMSDLLLEQKFNDPQLHLEAQNIARARTLTVLVGLDGERKGRLVQFLYESGLITAGTENCISLQHADLRDADLRGLDLSKANLNEANLSRAQLSEINLSEAQLQNIDLREADLNGAILRHTNLYKAKLNEAILNDAFLQEANLTEAILSEARLERADLTRADFSDAIVNGAKLEGAIYDNKIFSNVQLSKIWKP